MIDTPDTHETHRLVRDEPELQIVVVEPEHKPTRRQADAAAYAAYRRAVSITGHG